MINAIARDWGWVLPLAAILAVVAFLLAGTGITISVAGVVLALSPFGIAVVVFAFVIAAYLVGIAINCGMGGPQQTTAEEDVADVATENNGTAVSALTGNDGTAGDDACQAATDALAQAEAQLAQARNGRAQRQGELDSALVNQKAAFAIMTAAGTALAAAPLWNVLAVAAAATALALAAANWASRNDKVTLALGRLASAETAVAAAEGAVGEAQSAKNAACGGGSSSGATGGPGLVGIGGSFGTTGV